MEKYKSIYEESNNKKEIVDISKLKWSNTKDVMSYEEAIKNTPKGYRLPTIQELYTAYVKKVKGFYGNYWSSTVKSSKSAYVFYFDMGKMGSDKKLYHYFVRYVKKKDNAK